MYIFCELHVKQSCTVAFWPSVFVALVKHDFDVTMATDNSCENSFIIDVFIKIGVFSKFTEVHQITVISGQS